MALRKNPTRTGRIERRWKGEINRRWREYSKRTIGYLRRFNAAQPATIATGGGVAILVNEAEPFQMDQDQQRIYMEYVQQQIDELLMGSPTPPNWQAAYQLEAYERALADIRGELTRQGARIQLTEVERLAAEGIETLAATPSLATGPTSQPIHRDSLEFLFLRSYDTLQGWTDTLARETRQILFNGVALGQGIDEITANMQDRIGVSRGRARRIAQTETNQAYSRGSIAEIERASEETGSDIKTRWITSRDIKVRHSHAEIHGVVMTTQRAQQIKIDDGINCRCALTAVVPGTNTKRRQARFDAERAALLALERK